MIEALLVMMVMAPLVLDCWLAFREWDSRRFPAERFLHGRKMEAFSLEETF